VIPSHVGLSQDCQQNRVVEAYTHWNAVKESFSEELAEEKEELLVADNFMRHFIDCVGKVLSISLLEQHHALSTNFLENLLEELSRKTTSVLTHFFFELNIENVL